MAICIDPPRVLAELTHQKEARPELRAVIDLHQAILAVQVDVVAPGPPSLPSGEEVQTRVAQGSPLLSPGAIEVPLEQFVTVYDAICDVIAERRPDLTHMLASLRDSPARWSEDLFARADVAYRLPVGDSELRAPSLAAFVTGSASRPFLWAHARVLAPLIDDQQWYRGRCPVCGGEPDLAALGEGGRRRLLCSRCDTEWLYRRVGCPFCGNTDHRKLAYFTDDGETYRLYVCEVCRRYIKTADQRECWRVLPLPVERVLTVGMDLAALEAGYEVGTLAAS